MKLHLSAAALAAAFVLPVQALKLERFQKANKG